MQKKLIALAVAAVASGAAFADTNVTVYGVVDAAQESVKASGATAGSASDIVRHGRLSTNSSHIGFKGSEDLGNGLKAVFQIETTVKADVGGFDTGRDTYVGLSGGFGTVLAGRLTHAARTLGVAVDNNPGASGIGFTGSMYGQMVSTAGTIKTGADSRANNAIAYVSPTMGGLTGYLAYINGTHVGDGGSDAADATKPKAYQVAVTYATGGLLVGYGHHEAKAVLLSTIDAKVDRFAAKYSFGQGTSVSGLWDRTKLTDGTDQKRDAWMLGVNQAFGASNVFLQYAKAGERKGANGASNTGAKQLTLGYTYNLSKRTLARAYYTKITNDSAANYDFYNNSVGTVNNGADPAGFGFGLRHSF